LISSILYLSFTMKRGLFFTSRYIFPIYSPINPKKRIFNPPINDIGITIDVHPGIASPCIFVYNAHALKGQ